MQLRIYTCTTLMIAGAAGTVIGWGVMDHVQHQAAIEKAVTRALMNHHTRLLTLEGADNAQDAEEAGINGPRADREAGRGGVQRQRDPNQGQDDDGPGGDDAEAARGMDPASEGS